MRGNDEARDEALARLRDLPDETVEQVLRVRKEASQPAGGAKDAHQHATSARVRVAQAKRRELAAHARARLAASASIGGGFGGSPLG